MRSLGAGETERLLAGSVARRFPGVTSTCREGDPGQAAFLVLRGDVCLCWGGGNVVFAMAYKGGLFGEAELVTQRPARASSATAVGEVDVVELPAPLLMEVGRGNP